MVKRKQRLSYVVQYGGEGGRGYVLYGAKRFMADGGPKLANNPTQYMLLDSHV